GWTRRGAAAGLCALIAGHGLTALVQPRALRAAPRPVPASQETIFSEAADRALPRRSTSALAARPAAGGPELTAARPRRPATASQPSHLPPRLPRRVQRSSGSRIERLLPRGTKRITYPSSRRNKHEP